ncbi:MAG: hypothetical protein HC879_01580 [Leptolyngbyaceae cyanobacterium SL_5_9]|nr:hypothetical protein [Leptolyngbyaceae cyanobacterium SL_5_9]NJO73588.1 hypothetical protein [Leptolyngbyaceae cyanobacterium RM1_406_9]
MTWSLESQNALATQAIPVILLTAKIQSSDRRRYTEIGAVAAIAQENLYEIQTSHHYPTW